MLLSRLADLARSNRAVRCLCSGLCCPYLVCFCCLLRAWQPYATAMPEQYFFILGHDVAPCRATQSCWHRPQKVRHTHAASAARHADMATSWPEMQSVKPVFTNNFCKVTTKIPNLQNFLFLLHKILSRNAYSTKLHHGALYLYVSVCSRLCYCLHDVVHTQLAEDSFPYGFHRIFRFIQRFCYHVNRQSLGRQP